jgi:branched-chain amino acid transport system ATP-binding protein
MTVLDNVKVGCMSRSSAGLLAAILRTPAQKREEMLITEKCKNILKFLDIDQYAGHIANNLSYGQQRRVEIARALAGEPELLLLDEPAAGMNSSEKLQLADIINKINKEMGMTILIVEHDMKIVLKITHTVCVLNYGKMIAIGTPEEIQNNPEVIDAYLGGEAHV